MSTDQMRQEFEVWAESRGLDLYCSRDRVYEETETQWAWSAWKASRAAQAELPLANCRQRLASEGKPYPRSSCAVCGQFSPRWKECDALISARQGEQP